MTNYSGQGAGGDPVQADSQDAAVSNNANFSTPSDGLLPRMQMGIWDVPAPRTVSVNAGSGLPASFVHGISTTFGPQTYNVTTNVVKAQPPLANVALTNAAQVNGNIALIDRGSANFTVKVKNAQNAGAVGVIIANNVAGAGVIGMTGTDATITIPSVFISKEDGDLIKAALTSGTVNITLLRGAAPPRRDSSFDATVVVHEYGHGVSNRLTGGPANSNALTTIQSRGMGEGWSDFFALVFTQLPTDQANDPIGEGAYVAGLARHSAGIRRQPYSFDLSVDPITFQAYNNDTTQEVHNTGEIWASALWDMNWLLINKYGYDSNLSTGYTGTGAGAAGNKLALQLVEDALKLQPANPTFTQARDAVLLADQIRTGGANQAEIWQAFARRGLGAAASTASSSATSMTLSFAAPTDAPRVSTADVAVVPGQTIAIAFDRAMYPESFSLASDVVEFSDSVLGDHRAELSAPTWTNGNRTLQLTVSASLPLGEYTLRIGPNVTDAEGHLLNQDGDAIVGENPDDIATVGVTAFQTLTVATATDEFESFDPGTLSLREAIELATRHAGADTITFAPTVTGPIILTLGQLDFHDTTAPLIISGPASALLTISGNDATRVIIVAAYALVTLERLEITHGRSSAAAGILNDGTLTLRDVLVSSNASTDDDGGGAKNRGQMIMVNSTFQGNVGAGMENLGIATAVNSTFSGNTTLSSGGGIYNFRGEFTLANCTVVGNVADSDNNASGSGGGIFLDEPRDLVTLNNTIVAGNYRALVANGDDIAVISGAAVNASASFNNLIGAGSGGLANGVNGNLVGIADPLLGALQNNGDLTPNRVPLIGSPALDGGNNGKAVDELGGALAYDQRGRTRIADGDGNGSATVDIGAVESQPYVVVNIDDAGPGSLRQAILDANALGVASTITFNLPAGVHSIALMTNLQNLSNPTIFGVPSGVTVAIGTATAFTLGDFSTLTKMGAGTLVIGGTQTHSGAATLNANAGTLSLASDAGANLTLNVNATVNLNATQRLAAINIANGATASVAAGGDKVLVTSGLSIAGTGQLDLIDNDLVFQATAGTKAAVLTDLTAKIISGYGPDAPHWLGSGLTSSVAAANGTHLTALGVMLNANALGQPIYTTFSGEAVNNNSVLVKFTYVGDANLSGIVDGTDYAFVDNGFNFHLSGWVNGDFNYSGTVDGTDYAIIDNAFNSQAGPLASQSAPLNVLFGLSAIGYDGLQQTGVPEPASAQNAAAEPLDIRAVAIVFEANGIEPLQESIRNVACRTVNSTEQSAGSVDDDLLDMLVSGNPLV